MLAQPEKESLVAYPEGHFYSPTVSLEDVTKRRTEIWKGELATAGIDYRPADQKRFIQGPLTRSLPLYDYAPKSDQEGVFYDKNPAFSWLDSRTLFSMLLMHKPKRMIEVGSGYSSLLTADVNVRFLDGKLDFTCIEPYPKEFLTRGVPGISRLIESAVQDVPLSTFAELEKGDILFIDSSHVSKTGSDVNYLLFEVLPVIQPGVCIHFHDIFLPREYPEEWVFDDQRSWNEQYLLRALLMGSSWLQVVFGCAYASYAFPDELRAVLNGQVFGGGSFWLLKTAQIS